MPKKGPKRLLVEWANDQDQWVRFIVAEAIASGQPLGGQAVDDAYDRLVVEKDLKQGAAVNVPLLKATGTNGENVEKLELVRTGDCAA